MAAIDKIYGTQEQYDELEAWIKKDAKRRWITKMNKKALSQMYSKEGYPKQNRPIAKFSYEVDMWLLNQCPFLWLNHKIREQYYNLI